MRPLSTLSIITRETDFRLHVVIIQIIAERGNI